MMLVTSLYWLTQWRMILDRSGHDCIHAAVSTILAAVTALEWWW